MGMSWLGFKWFVPINLFIGLIIRLIIGLIIELNIGSDTCPTVRPDICPVGHPPNSPTILAADVAVVKKLIFLCGLRRSRAARQFQLKGVLRACQQPFPWRVAPGWR